MFFRPLTNVLRNYTNHHCTKQIIRPNHGKKVDDITKEVVIIGNTWTALGLASLALQSGHSVKLVNTEVHKNTVIKFRPKILEDLKAVAKKKHKGNFTKQDKFITEAIDRLQVAKTPDKFFSNADIVIDAFSFRFGGTLRDIFNFFGNKRWVVKQWSKKSPSNSIFVYAKYVPTSGYEKSGIFHAVIQDLAIMTSVFRRRSNIVEVNLVDPIPKYKLAEIKKLYGLTGDTIKRTMLWLKEMDIDGVVVQETGDIKRSMVKLHNLLHKVENGSMTVCDIDLLTKMNSTNHFVLWVVSKISNKIAVFYFFSLQYFMISTTNFAKNPIGPFEMADFIGLDKAKSIIDDIGYQEQVDGGEKYKENMLLKYLIKEGKLGRKTGEGFYTYNKLPSDKIVVLDKSRHTFL